MGSGGDWRRTGGRLEVDSMDEMWTGGGVHKDPWGSVIYRFIRLEKSREPALVDLQAYYLLTTLLDLRL